MITRQQAVAAFQDAKMHIAVRGEVLRPSARAVLIACHSLTNRGVTSFSKAEVLSEFAELISSGHIMSDDDESFYMFDGEPI